MERFWYQKNCISWMLVPFSWVYQAICLVRQRILILFFQQQFPIPVVIVGNISVGGVGKTPLVIAIAKVFSQKGLKVGIVSRGYRAKSRSFPCWVHENSCPTLVGDEPLLIAKRTGCPVVISPNRVDAIRTLLKRHACDVVLSDDGLQHYAMGRTVEIVVIDGARGLGNGYCLPAGPLREAPRRIKHCDLVVINGENKALILDTGAVKQYSMTMHSEFLVSLVDGQQYSIKSFKDTNTVFAAVAGIANPARFFASLKAMGLLVKEYSFADHFAFKSEDLNFSEEFVVMTEKDAVKCQEFARKNWFYVPLEVTLPEAFWNSLDSQLQLTRSLPL